MDDFIWRAVLGGLAVAAVTGALGCVVVWRRMAYFGATLSHSALLGVALGFLLGVDLTLSVFVLCLVLALGLLLLQRQTLIANDTLLGILAHGSLALGLVLIASLEGLRVDLMSYLFGDILAISRADLGLIALVVVLAGLGLGLIWRDLLAVTIHAELAQAEGLRVQRVELIFVLLLAAVIAIGMKLVGMLLIVSLLIIPAACSRRFAKTPEQMLVLAVLIACATVVLGLAASMLWDVPTGPAIVVIASGLFVVQLLPILRLRH